MKFAAFVGFEEADCDGEDESFSPHACRRGEGTAGTVGFDGRAEMRKRGVDTPLTFGDENLLIRDGEVPRETGNGNDASVG
jgi:hypothetical protein